MVWQDRFETNLLQLFAHPETSEWFSIISVITSEVNIVAAQKQAQLIYFVFCKFPLPSTHLLPPCPTAFPASLDSCEGTFWAKMHLM